MTNQVQLGMLRWTVWLQFHEVVMTKWRNVSAAVAKKRTEKQEETGKIEIRADAAWIARVDEAAARIKLKRSAFIRMIVTQAMDRDDNERRRQEG